MNRRTTPITRLRRVILPLENARPATRVHWIGMPGMPTNLWGVSPLYENETLLEGSIPNVVPEGASTRWGQLRKGDRPWERSLRRCA